MSEDQQEPNPAVEREERRLERLRLVSMVDLPERFEDEEEPESAA